MTNGNATTPTTAPAASSAKPDQKSADAKAQRADEKQTQEQEIMDHRAEMADRHDDVVQKARAGEEASFEGARPEFEPLPGEAKGSIPDGLTVGGPVLSLDEQDRIARQRGKDGSPVPTGKAKNQLTSND